MTPKLSLRDVVVRRGHAEILHVSQLDLNEGEVRFDGEPVAGRELALRRRMAVVFQESLLLNRSVEANARLGLSLRGVPRREQAERARHWLARFGVEELAGRTARTLSGGEAQRVSLARAFALEPEVVLLDEPFSALDQPTRETLIEELASVLRETRTTTVFVTHDRDEAARLADRVVVLADGRVRQVGPTAEVFAAPADETVASYVGVETVVLARVVSSRDGLVTLKVGEAQVEAASDDFATDEALFCLRPDDVVLSSGDVTVSDSARNHLRGVVKRIVVVGSEVRIEVDCGFPLVATITRRSREELGLEVGSKVGASFKATAVHLIPRDSRRSAAASG